MSNRYARSQIVLHWLTLLMVILTYAAMLLKDSVPEAWAPMVKNLHFNFGVSVFALMLIRLAVRSFHAAPPTTPPLEEWQEVGAKIFHWLLYVVFLMLPLLHVNPGLRREIVAFAGLADAAVGDAGSGDAQAGQNGS